MINVITQAVTVITPLDSEIRCAPESPPKVHTYIHTLLHIRTFNGKTSLFP